jgi:hypothetical protein
MWVMCVRCSRVELHSRIMIFGLIPVQRSNWIERNPSPEGNLVKKVSPPAVMLATSRPPDECNKVAHHIQGI